MKKDFYKILGVATGSTEAQIKKAYKQLAMEWHPDRHQGDKKAEEKFKEISEAYQTLSDAKKRQQYDTFGNAEFGNMGGNTTSSTGGFDFGDIFGGASGGQRQQSSQGFEFDLGDLFSGLGGRRSSGQASASMNRSQLDINQTIEVPLWDMLLGTKLSLEMVGSSFKVTVPAGMKPGTRLKVTGKGRKHGRITGDLYLKIEARMPKKLTAEQERVIGSWRS